jgi:tetrahydromethanopterin S-methyltransferase subunit E
MAAIVLLFAWTLVIVVLAFVACMFEDLESDTGSQSNPNSQVQLAAQIGYVHRFFNKAISGEGPAYAMYCTVAGVIAWAMLSKLEPIYGTKAAILAIPVGALAGELVHIIFATTAHLGRTAASKRFQQPIYLDVLYGHLVPIAAHGFIATICITAIAYIQCNLGVLSGIATLNHRFSLPLLCFIWGVTVGAIGSSTGDIHYGTEREFQDRPFGEGKRVVYHGKITRYAECGIRTQKDIVGFCAKYGGPCTGLTFGLIILFENWRTLVGMMAGGLGLAALGVAELNANTSVIAGIVIGIIVGIGLVVGNMALVRWTRRRYGPFVGE